MNPIKQALIAYKTNWKQSLYLGVVATLYTFFSQVIPTLGALLITFGLLIFQELANLYLENGSWRMDLSHLKEDGLSFFLTSVIMMPTGILFGSAFGILESPQGQWQNLPFSLLLFILGVYFYFILSHGLRLKQQTSLSFVKAMDVTSLASIKNFRLYFPACFYVSLILMVASLLRGLGFIVALPILFYCSHFVFIRMKQGDCFKSS